MKKIVLLIILFSATMAGMAQLKDPVQWNFGAVKKAEKVYEVTFTATIVKPWHIYSQLTPPGGPVPTKIVFKTNPLITVNGKAKENGSLKNVHDQFFGVDVKYFDNQVAFVQTVNLKSNVKTNIAGTIEYMVCNDEECLPPKKVPFDLKLQ
ncbi:MAG TPA: protein-disulfide reductase DsbD domain-containing protein [Chitinophagaceae bacterium]|jgi:thiol:disulfide interchange protein DsbD